MLFHGTGDDVEFGVSVAQALSLATGDYTVEFWTNPASSQNTNACIVCSPNWGVQQDGNATNRYRWYVVGAHGKQWSPDFPIAPSAWHHVAVTFRKVSALITVYVDGQQVVTATSFANPTLNKNNMYFGHSPSGGDFWSGILDSVRLSDMVRYTTSTTASIGLLQVADRKGPVDAVLRPGTVSFIPPIGPMLPDAQTLALWNLDEGTGTTVIDSTPDHYAGEFEGALQEPTWVIHVPAPPPEPTAIPTAFTAPTVAPAPAIVPPSPQAVVVVPNAAAPPPIQKVNPNAFPKTGAGGAAGDDSWGRVALIVTFLGILAGARLALHGSRR